MSDHQKVLAEALKDVDPKKLPHGLQPYKRFGPKTVRAILAVRDLVVHTPQLATCKFRIGLTTNAVAQEAAEQREDCATFAIIHESSDIDEVRTVEADVRLNFLWHFPGRCLNKGDYRHEEIIAGSQNYVYVTCFTDSSPTVLGQA